MNAEQLEKMMGFAPGELEKAAEAYEKDEWPKCRTVKLGRPPDRVGNVGVSAPTADR